ncbi:unnamed protein product [Phytophthora lilii]|uniref:Unnamed protein product n=1 Tax=Phytophthora lilii TaxID=2077276 RepID=A0A9W6TZP8_9STRA|nr:unnamed protein product [Phytophthora lilii]
MDTAFRENTSNHFHGATQGTSFKVAPSIFDNCCAAELLSAFPVPIVKEEPMHQVVAPHPAAKPKKKRIRRQKLELDYLRKLVGKLEDEMAQLKAKQPFQIQNAESSRKATPIWKGIAERQLKERERAEEKNRNLRVSLEGQLKLANKLEGLLHKRPRDEVLMIEEAIV